MKAKLQTLYALFGGASFFVIFLVLFPLFLLPIHIKAWRGWIYPLNKVWAWLSYLMIAIPVRRRFEAPIDPRRTYVYCANHTSFLDIPAIGLTVNQLVIFMGKASLAKVPVFGYMFGRIHISVDRDSLQDRYRAFEKAKEEIRQNHSVVIFPEGNMRNPKPPKLRKFKDGAFRMAIEEQVPIIPVSLPFHWKIMFAYTGKMSWHRDLVIYHKPIETKGMTLEHLDQLKNQVYEIISKAIEHENNILIDEKQMNL